MKIKYYSDTDTAFVELNDKLVAETVEVTEDLYVDLDEQGRIVSLTIEHAKESAGLRDLELQGVG